MKRLLLVALVGTATFLVLGVTPAVAKTPCWKKVVSDWYDNGRIDKVYPVGCYREALRNLPVDVRQYADAHDVISRALQTVLLSKGNDKGGGKNSGSGKGGSGNGGASGVLGTSGGDTGTRGGPSRGEADGQGIFNRAIERLGPNNADSIPIPLIVLGSLALLLLAAGAAGMVARKLQERRLRPATVPRRTEAPPTS